MKKIIAAAAVCAVSAAAVAVVPDMMIESYPTAKNVTVSRIEHVDKYELTGNIVKSGADGSMYVRAYASEKEISGIKLGQKAEITGDAFPDCVYEGEVSYIADYAMAKQIGNTAKVVVEIKIDIINPDDRLKAGYTANTAIILSEAETVDILPYDVVNQDENGEYVYIIKDNKAEKRYIQTGEEFSEGVEVVSGIEYDDRVIKPDDVCSEGDTVLLVE